ncbi:hypothetical protein ACQUY5_32690, partial [Bacillus cereus]|uniref:hypothetical protein n=1 Tax=Bacillus cereus TaxID=1396 RepID=UPI003D163400
MKKVTGEEAVTILKNKGKLYTTQDDGMYLSHKPYYGELELMYSHDVDGGETSHYSGMTLEDVEKRQWYV